MEFHVVAVGIRKEKGIDWEYLVPLGRGGGQAALGEFPVMGVYIFLVPAVEGQAHAFWPVGQGTAVRILAEAEIAVAGIKDPAEAAGLYLGYREPDQILVEPGSFFDVFNGQENNAAFNRHKIYLLKL